VKALAMMRDDLDIVFSKHPKKTKEEIEREVEEFFAENVNE
jgi:hypothetical protein